uniref:SMB domain-containing protein n=1 Tax=Globodera pallida TaxID=36090 RepID=A0A183BSA4_GLOPA
MSKMFARLCAPITLIGTLLIVAQLIEYGWSDGEAFRDVNLNYECAPKCACGWAKCVASKGSPASACCDRGYAFECCATATPTFEWKTKTSAQLINELKAKGKKCESGHYCMCGFVYSRQKLAGLCCYNDTDHCQCCDTELAVPQEMKVALKKVNYQCTPLCVRSEDWPAGACCSQNYRLQCCDPFGERPETDPCEMRAVLCKADDVTCAKKKGAQGKELKVRHISKKWTNEDTIINCNASLDCDAANYWIPFEKPYIPTTSSLATTGKTTTQSSAKPKRTRDPKPGKTGTKMPSTTAANGADVSVASGMPPKPDDDFSFNNMRCTTMDRCYSAILEREMLDTLGKSYQFKRLYTVRRGMTEQVNSDTLQCVVHVVGCSTGLFTEFVLDDFFTQKGAFMDEYIKWDNNLC